MKVLIVGRSGSGKDTLLGEMERAYGVAAVKSYTTRPRRAPDEDTHVFITAEESVSINDKVATTVINGYEYFATRTQVENAQAYIIDPIGVDELLGNMPDTQFVIVYCRANEETRKFRAVERAANKTLEAAIFSARNADERDQFDQFEAAIQTHTPDDMRCYAPHNNEKTYPVIIWDNDYTKRGMKDFLLLWDDFFRTNVRGKWTKRFEVYLLDVCRENGEWIENDRHRLGGLALKVRPGKTETPKDILSALSAFRYKDVLGKEHTTISTTDGRTVYAEDYYGDGTWWEVGVRKGYRPIYGLKLIS